MARLLIDGFESGGYDLYAASANASVISSAGKDLDGSYCLDLTTGGAYVYKLTAAAGISEVYLAVLWRPSAPSDLQPIFRLQNGVADIATLYRNNSTNKLQAYRKTTLIDTGTKTISNDTTYLIEVYFKLADAGGRFVVKVDGVIDIDFTGDTKDGLETVFNRIYLGRDDATKTTKAYFDNFKIDDAAYPGSNKIQAIVPTGAGNTTEWTPSAGNNWSCVDEIPKNDADYVSTTGVKKDTYAAGNMAGSIASIKCVQIQSRSKSISFTNTIKLIVRSGGADYEGDGGTVEATFLSHYYIWETDPADAAAWEEADVNAIEIGVKNNTGNNLGSYQVLAQIEWEIVGTIDETERLVTLTLTVSETDDLNHEEEDRLVSISSIVAVVDTQNYLDLDLLISLTSAVSIADLQSYFDTDLLTVILVTVDELDVIGFLELSRLVNLSLEVSETDIQAYIDDVNISLSLVPTVSDIQNYLDTGLSVALTMAISVFDSVPLNDTDLLVNITSAVSETDFLAIVENVNIPLTISIAETDVFAQIESLMIPITMQVSEFDGFVENLLVSMLMTISEIDGFPADARETYELISREKSFELIGRTKTYYLEKG